VIASLLPKSPGSAEPGKGEALYRLGTLQASYFHAWLPSGAQVKAGLFSSALLKIESAHG